MRHALRPFLLLAALHVTLLVPTQARADEPAAELRAPAPPSSDVTAALGNGIAKLPEELRASFPAVVDGARSRWRAGQKASADGSGSAIGIDEAARAAVLAVDFGGASKRKSQLEVMVRLTVLQLTVDLHAALRDELGRRLAMRAVKRCKGASACLDKIAPTATMPAQQVTTVRHGFDRDPLCERYRGTELGRERQKDRVTGSLRSSSTRRRGRGPTRDPGRSRARSGGSG